MPLEKAPYWTDLYYRVVEHYFWKPQGIGRKSDPDKPSHPWRYWQDKLESQETPLNHILDFLFHIAPEELLDRVVSALIGRQISNLQLVSPTPGTIDGNVVQPDIIVSNSTELVFIEMKVDSKYSIDQYTKYAIAADCIIQGEPEITSVDLVLLSRHKMHEKIWKKAKQYGFTSGSEIREVAIRALENNDQSIWDERGVQRYINSYPNAIPQLIKQIKNMELHIADYSDLESVLLDYAEKETVINRLIHGVIQEFGRRDLVNNKI